MTKPVNWTQLKIDAFQLIAELASTEQAPEQKQAALQADIRALLKDSLDQLPSILPGGFGTAAELALKFGEEAALDFIVPFLSEGLYKIWKAAHS